MIGSKPLRIRFDKKMDSLEFMIELDIYYYLEEKNMTSSSTGSDIL